jgi:Tfp pilus assembly protein PilX
VQNRPPAERGSAILAVMIFAAILAVMAAYFIRHASTESGLATRAYFQSTAMNLAEAGVDEAMLDINNANVGTGTGWRAATDNAASWVKLIDGTGNANYRFGAGTGKVYVRVDNWTANTTATVTVTSVGQVALPAAAPVNRQIVVKVAKRPAQGAGLLSKGSIVFNGNVVIDSYNSSTGVPDPTTNRSDQVVVATTSATATVSVGGNAQVYGFVATGGVQPTVGTNGRIYGSTTASAVKVDPTRVRNDFVENIPAPTLPTGTAINLGSISSNISLPRVGDTPQANGRYLYSDFGGGVQLSGSTVLTITGPVDIIVTSTMTMSGNGQVLLTSSGGSSPSMNLYASGSVQIGGNGMSNTTNVPANVHVYAMGTAAVDLNGNADFTGVIYAPTAQVNANGNGNINGAIVGNAVVFNGNAKLHYDVQLGSSAASPYYALRSWVELTDGSTTGRPFARDRRDPFTFL